MLRILAFIYVCWCLSYGTASWVCFLSVRSRICFTPMQESLCRSSLSYLEHWSGKVCVSDLRFHISCEKHTVRDSSKDLGKKRDSQYPPLFCFPLYVPLPLSFLVTHISTSSYLPKPLFTHYCCFLEVMFLLLK